MKSIVDGIGRFRGEALPSQRATRKRLARDGRDPEAPPLSHDVAAGRLDPIVAETTSAAAAVA